MSRSSLRTTTFPSPTMRACAARPEIQDLIQREIETVNANFARVETIKKFFLIERQLTPEDEELTPTMKLKRNFVNKRYADRDRRHVSRARGGLIAPANVFETAKDSRGHRPFAQHGPRERKEETEMSKSLKALGLAVGALALTQLPAIAQTKVTNEGISANRDRDRHPSGFVRSDQGLGRAGFQRHENGGRGDQCRRRHQWPQAAA